MSTVHRFAQPVFGGSRVRCGMRRVGVLSASGPVRSCQLAGSPASHGQLCVARVFPCQVQLVSSAQRPSVGYSCCNCPATAAFGLSQLWQLHLPLALQLFAAAAAFPLLRSKLPLSLTFPRLTSSLTSPWALGSSASLGLTSLATSCHASSLPPANVAGKGLPLTSLGYPRLPLGPLGRVTSE